MQVPILSGIYADQNSDFRTSLPRNLIPVPKDTGLSKGYLAPAEGLIAYGTVGPGIDRGGISWNGVLYRAMGTKLVRVAEGGVITVLGEIGIGGPVSFDYSFDRLAVASAGNLFYWDGAALTHVTDPDLGQAVDMLWVSGYFVTTDGTSLVVTELNDPYAVSPLKYGSSEVDPDPIIAIKKVGNEVVAINRYSTEYFQNVGGSNFPFTRIDGAMFRRGAIGLKACTVYRAAAAEAVAFLGGARNEPAAVWVGAGGGTQKISTKEIDSILQDYSSAQLATAVMEERIDRGHQYLYLHLPNQTIAYDVAASATVGEPIWIVLDSAVRAKDAPWRARFFVRCYDKWIFGDPQSPILGTVTDATSSHYGSAIGWEFGTSILYTEGRGAVLHELELIGLPGGPGIGKDPVIWTSYSLDGKSWSMERSTRAGYAGQNLQRICWRRLGIIRNWRIQKFRGTSDCHMPIARLEMTLEALNG